MSSIYKELLPVELMRRRKGDTGDGSHQLTRKMTNKELCNILGLNARFVQRIRKRLEVDKENPRPSSREREGDRGPEESQG
ncbi:Hypothetical protein FKW44_017915 [Caligus rogercresseyi]|uniref:Uncharacterized protein n=1 Tax=Caligus rogercresseyi TaxID=217165 RepID=A0A7T8JXL2_CALRO|nr:Hypothetical protein FKW44_017915 [Caligus rogercresseyi]